MLTAEAADLAEAEERHAEECRKHAWMLSEAYERLALRNCQLSQAREELHYERNLVGVLTERLDERDADYKRLAGMHQAQAETIGKQQREIADLAQLAADRVTRIARLRKRIAELEGVSFDPAIATTGDNTRGGIWS